MCLPVGNAGNISAYWCGFKRFAQHGHIQSRPCMLGFQAAGAAPIVHDAPVDYPETLATAIRIGDPASWRLATAARDESCGLIDAVTDEEIVRAWRDLAALEGVFCEPASAAGIAGLRKVVESKRINGAARFVAILTGHGLKDPALAVEQFAQPVPIEATMPAILNAVGW